MASATITETGVTMSIYLYRTPGQADMVYLTAESLTDSAIIPIGRKINSLDITSQLNATEASAVTSVLDAIQAQLKALWSIP